MTWDTWLQQKIGKLRAKWRKRKENADRNAEESVQAESISVDSHPQRQSSEAVQRRTPASSSREAIAVSGAGPAHTVSTQDSESRDGVLPQETTAVADTATHGIRLSVGLAVIAAFFSKPVSSPF